MRRILTAALAAAALTLSACKDSTGPDALQLTDAQAEDLMEALASIGSTTTLAARGSAEYRSGPAAQEATVTLDETEPCPNGGTHRVQGSLNMNDAGTQMTANITQGYTGCKATSPNGVLWTVDGAPNIVLQFSMTFSEATGEFTLTGTQKGAIDASSTIGSGRCPIDLSYTASGNLETGGGSATVSGTVCGRTISMTVTE